MFHIIVNPVGASGNTGRIWEETEPVFAASGQPYTVHRSSAGHGITEICRELTDTCDNPLRATQSTGTPSTAENRPDCPEAAAEFPVRGANTLLAEENDSGCIDLVIVGGDGSLNEALNGIRDISRVRLGFIPAGSGNDLARDLNLPKNPAAVAQRILEGRVCRTSDVGVAECSGVADAQQAGSGAGTASPDTATPGTDAAAPEGAILRRRFLTSCGMGFDAAICEYVSRAPLKKLLNALHLGKLIYLMGALHLIFRYRNQGLTVCYDGKRTVRYPRVLLAVAMNHCYEGGGFRFCPHADPADGLLDTCIADPKTNFAFFRVFPSAYSGRHLKYSVVHEDRGHQIEFTSPIPLWIHTDGEVNCRASRLVVRTTGETLRMLV